ncbi:MAG: radical SAM protein [Desulfatibacillaceae bacterium]
MRQTVAFTRDARNVFFHILTQCNLRCAHCYINREEHGHGMLPLETIESWLGHLALPGKESNVIFLGGEPTMHPDLPGAVRAAQRLGYSSVTIDTNGYLFHDFPDRVDPSEVDYISFSLDGATPELNDEVRGRGCYETCVAGIRRCVDRGFATSVIYTVSSNNFHELHLMPELLAGLGVERFFIQVIGLRGKAASGEKGLQLNRGTWSEIVPNVASRAAELGIAATFPRVFLEPGEVFECAGNVAENYFVFPNGRVYRCPLCEDYAWHALEIGDQGLVERGGITETNLFSLEIPEGCVMNRLIQPENIERGADGKPLYRIACCLLKELVEPAGA